MKKLSECCVNFAITSEDDRGQNHHKNCPKYSTEKFPWLFYYEEAISSFTPAPDEVCHIVDVIDQLSDGDDVEIKFKRFDMTDKEFDEMPVE